MTACVHLIIGPVGAGKSTLAAALARRHGAVVFDLDAWMARLFAADRPAEADMPTRLRWYGERTARCIEQIWCMARASVEVGVSVVLEIGLVRRAERLAFYERVDAAGLELRVILVDAPRDLRRTRVEARNRDRGPTFDMVVPPNVFELASDAWEAPDDRELLERDVLVM